jgi:hypothetical protein
MADAAGADGLAAAVLLAPEPVGLELEQAASGRTRARPATAIAGVRIFIQTSLTF